MADIRQPGMPKVMEVIHDPLDAALVVHPNVGDVLGHRPHVIENDRRLAGRELANQPGVHFGDNGGQAGHPPPDHEPDTLAQPVGLVIGVGHHHVVSVLASVGLQGAENVEEERVLHVGGDHAEGLALASGQRAGMQVGVIVQLGHRLDHPGAGGASHDGHIVQDAGYRGRGDAGAFGYFFKAHRVCAIWRRAGSTSPASTGDTAREPKPKYNLRYSGKSFS